MTSDRTFSNTDLSKIEHTGTLRALFFNGAHLPNLELAIERYIPGEITPITDRSLMKMEINRFGINASIPSTVPRLVPESEYGSFEETEYVAMAITDLKPDAFLAAVSAIGIDSNGIFRDHVEQARMEDPEPEE